MHTSSHMTELELLTSMGRGKKKLSGTYLFGKMSFAPGIASGVSVGVFLLSSSSTLSLSLRLSQFK